VSRQSRRFKAISEKVEHTRRYPALDAFRLLKECATARFPESVDASVRLGVDPRKSDQIVRGSSILPNGTGRKIRVAVFAQGEQAQQAKEAGAEIVGYEDLLKRIQEGKLDFDTLIATPEAMPLVGKCGQIIGPRGLMPNPKVGTVASDVAKAVNNAKGGQVRYRTDKAGIIHCGIGKVSFEAQALKENLETLLADLAKLKPSAAKGSYLRKIAVSTTMGPGLTIEPGSLAL